MDIFFSLTHEKIKSSGHNWVCALKLSVPATAVICIRIRSSLVALFFKPSYPLLEFLIHEIIILIIIYLEDHAKHSAI